MYDEDQEFRPDLAKYAGIANAGVKAIHDSPIFASEARLAFDYQKEDSQFASNWNDPLVVALREKLLAIVDKKVPAPAGVKVSAFWTSDQTLLVIELEEQEKMYTMSWYKQRGETESFIDVIRESKPIRLLDFLELYYIIIEEGEVNGIK